ncbi:MAG: hypothetical protein ACOYKE_01300, partial [Ferruginibacter sp.]
MTNFHLRTIICCLLLPAAVFAQAPKKRLNAKRSTQLIKIDGIIDEQDWLTAPVADSFVELRPTPF